MVKFDGTASLLVVGSASMDEVNMGGNGGQAPLILAWDISTILAPQRSIPNNGNHIDVQSACVEDDVDCVFAHVKILLQFPWWIDLAQAGLHVGQKFAQLLIFLPLPVIIDTKINIKRVLVCTNKIGVFSC